MRKKRSTHPSMTTCPRLTLTVALALGFAALTALRPGRAQERTRLNKVIEALENGRLAVGDREWRFIDMEHSPFSGVRLESILAEMAQDRDATGRLKLTPIVRIPQDGNEDFRWAVKQVLSRAGLRSISKSMIGISIVHCSTRIENVVATRIATRIATQTCQYGLISGTTGWDDGSARDFINQHLTALSGTA